MTVVFIRGSTHCTGTQGQCFFCSQVLSSVYFLVFLVLCVMWACYQSLGNRFSHFRILLLLYTGAHILTLYLYQFQFFQDALPRDDLVAR